MPVYEYNMFRRSLYLDQVADKMNEIAAEGWEIVNAQIIDQQYTQSLGCWVFVVRRLRT